MAISSVGSSGYAPIPVSTPATATAAKPDIDAPKPEAAAAGQEKDAPSSSQASSANLMKINPDGTVGPMHKHRHPNSPGVVHA